MALDIKKMITDMVEKIQKDDDLQKQFKKDPVKAIEKVLGVDLPDDIIEKVVDGVKLKMGADAGKELLGNIKKLFG